MKKREPFMKKVNRYFFSRYLDEGEEILHVAHRHILIFKFAAAKTSFFGLVMPVLLVLIFPHFLFFSVIWGALGLVAVFYHFVDYFFDAWILTNVGVIDVERGGFFDFTSTRIDYHMIEGISYTISGFVPTVFNYGDITIDKLGTATSVSLKDAAKPQKLERLVTVCQEKYLHSKSIKDHEALKDMLSQMIAYHMHNDQF